METQEPNREEMGETKTQQRTEGNTRKKHRRNGEQNVT